MSWLCTQAVAEHIVESRQGDLLPQHLANLAWAYARLTHAHPPLMAMVAQDALRVMLVGGAALQPCKRASWMMVCESRVSPHQQSCRHQPSILDHRSKQEGVENHNNC